MSKYMVFREHLTIIQTAIKTSVCQLADKCFQCGIIAETVHDSVVHGTKTPEDKARELLVAVGDQIKTDEQLKQTGNNSRFDKFVNTLEEEPVYQSLVRSLRDAWHKNMPRPFSDDEFTEENGLDQPDQHVIDHDLTQNRPTQSATPNKKNREKHIGQQEKEESQQEEQIQTQHLQVSDDQIYIAMEQEIKQLRQELDQFKKMTGKPTLTWKKCKPAPYRMFRGSATVCGNMAYFRPDASRQVYSYDSDTEEWSTLPVSRRLKYCFSIVVVNNLVTAVGGWEYGTFYSGSPFNTLLSFMEIGGRKKWEEYFPPMPTKRAVAAVVCSGRALVVAGGKDYTTLTTVEVMNTNTLQWSTASNLPHPLYGASATICTDHIYLVSGWDNDGPIKSVLTCSLSSLLQPITDHEEGAGHCPVWRSIADLPVNYSTCVALNGQLLAVGGRNLNKMKDTNGIYAYNIDNDSWEIVDYMPTPRYTCLATVLPGHKLMVVGGQSKIKNTTASEVTDNIEIATVE